MLLAAIGLIAAFCLVLFEPLFLGRCTLAFDGRDSRMDARPWADPTFDATEPINPITPDINGFVLPGLMRMQSMVAGRILPVRDDTQLLGFGFAANIAWPVLHPIGWLLLGLDPVDALDWMLVLHTIIGGLLTLRTARMLGASMSAAVLAAIAFPLSAWMYTRWHECLILYTTTWWPGILCAVEWLGRGKSWRAFVEGTLFTGLAAVSGFPQVTAMMLVGAGVLALSDARLRTARGIGTALTAAMLGLLLAAPQILLSFEAYATSLRSSELTRTSTAQRGLPPAALAGVLMPEFFGRPSDFATPAPPKTKMEDWLPQRRWIASREHSQNSVGELSLYAGLIPLLLLGIALRGRAGPHARRFSIVAVLAVVGCIVWPFVARQIPALAVLGAGNIKRALVLWNGCIPFAAAFAFDALRERRARLPSAWFGLLLVALALAPLIVRRIDDPAASAFAADLAGQAKLQIALLVAAFGALALARLGGWLAWLPAAVLLVDLALPARAFNPFPVQGPAWPRTPAIDALAARTGRVAVIGTINVLPSTAAAVHGIRNLIGMLPMVPARSAQLLACIEGPLLNPLEPRIARPLRDPASATHPLLDLLGVDTIVVGDAHVAGALDLPQFFRSDREAIAAFSRSTAMPRAFLVGGAEVVADESQRLARLTSRAFDPRATVLVEQAPSIELPARGSFQAAEVSFASPTRADVSISAATPGIVVLSEGWDPAWTATVDGSDAPVLIADHALLGVAVPAGEHAIAFEYRPRGLGIAIAAACAALLALCGAFLWGAVRAVQLRARRTTTS